MFCRFGTVAVALLTLAAVLACNRTPEPTLVPSPTPVNPQELFEQSGKVMANLDTFRFRLEHESGSTPLAENLVLIRAEGTILRPDKISIEFGGAVGGFAIKAQLISLGQESYMTNPLTGKWAAVPQEVSPLSFFDPQAGISSIMSQVTDASLVSRNDKTFKLRGTLRADALAPLFGTVLEGSLVSVEAVIDAERLYLLKATLTGVITPSEPEGVVRVIRISEFNEPVSIEAPDL